MKTETSQYITKHLLMLQELIGEENSSVKELEAKMNFELTAVSVYLCRHGTDFCFILYPSVYILFLE